MSNGDLAIFLGLFAAQWDVRLFLAESTARLATLRVLASELFVDLNRRTLHLKVTEGTFGEKVEARGLQVFQLLHVL